MKQVVVYYPDGTKTVLDHTPSWDEMKKLIDTDMLELVTVLDHITVVDAGPPAGKFRKFVFTRMFVDEDGMAKGKLRNEAATKIYQRNVREQFPNEEFPFRKATEIWEKQMRERFGSEVAIVSTVSEDYDRDDPPIIGTAIVFEGWTQAQVDKLFN